MPAPPYIVALLLTICFTVATCLQVRPTSWNTRKDTDNALKILLGDGRRIFANHFFVKADVYFHSGYYPSIFDQAAKKEAPNARTMTHEEHEGDHDEEAHEKAMEFLGEPRDWIDRFGRHFFSSKHSHLDKPGEAREILPWLRLSADLDPQHIDTYTVASFWLRKHLNKSNEAEQFLREGLRANPTSYEILYELGEIYYKDRHDPERARNIWELGERRWEEQQAADKHPDIFVYQQLTTELAELEEKEGNFDRALHYREIELKDSPTKEVVEQRIAELKQKMAAQSKPVTEK